jgi:hypothetical protein
LNPAFWAIHYNEQTYDLSASVLEQLFGLSLSQLEAFEQREMPKVVPREPDLDPCYSFVLPLPGGCSTWVEYDRCPDDSGLAYYLHRTSWQHPLLVCRRPSACDNLPFRWEEVVAMVEAVQYATPNLILRRAALPLLFSGVCVTTDDDLNQVRTRLRTAWLELGVAKPEYLDQMTEKMIGEAVYERWSHHPELGWVNNGRSLRNPKHSPPEFFARIKEFFDVLETC